MRHLLHVCIYSFYGPCAFVPSRVVFVGFAWTQLFACVLYGYVSCYLKSIVGSSELEPALGYIRIRLFH